MIAGSTFKILLPATISAFLGFGIPSTALANPPEIGSKQMDRMVPYAEFVQKMHNAGTSCCDIGDGRMGDIKTDLKEVAVQDPDGGAHYKVFVTRNIFSVDSHNPRNPASMTDHSYDAAIPPEGKWIEVNRDRIVTAKNVLGFCKAESKTCIPPSANILWLSSGGFVFCYWPVQHWGSITPTPKKTSPAVRTAQAPKKFPRRHLASLGL